WPAGLGAGRRRCAFAREPCPCAVYCALTQILACVFVSLLKRNRPRRKAEGSRNACLVQGFVAFAQGTYDSNDRDGIPARVACNPCWRFTKQRLRIHAPLAGKNQIGPLHGGSQAGELRHELDPRPEAGVKAGFYGKAQATRRTHSGNMTLIFAPVPLAYIGKMCQGSIQDRKSVV